MFKFLNPAARPRAFILLTMTALLYELFSRKAAQNAASGLRRAVIF
jgi:hypothetical protein